MNKSLTDSVIGYEAFDESIALRRVIFVNRLLWQRKYDDFICTTAKRYYDSKKKVTKSVFFFFFPKNVSLIVVLF